MRQKDCFSPRNKTKINAIFKIKIKSMFLKKICFYFVCVLCVCVCVNVSAEVLNPLGAGATANCELPDIGPRN